VSFFLNGASDSVHAI